MYSSMDSFFNSLPCTLDLVNVSHSLASCKIWLFYVHDRKKALTYWAPFEHNGCLSMQRFKSVTHLIYWLTFKLLNNFLRVSRISPLQPTLLHIYAHSLEEQMHLMIQIVVHWKCKSFSKDADQVISRPFCWIAGFFFCNTWQYSCSLEWAGT